MCTDKIVTISYTLLLKYLLIPLKLNIKHESFWDSSSQNVELETTREKNEVIIAVIVVGKMNA